MRKLTVIVVFAVLVLVPLGIRSMDDIDLGDNFYQITEEIVSPPISIQTPFPPVPICPAG